MVYVKQEVTIAHPLHTLEGVSFHVRTRPIIENLNPTVEEGRIHGLIGANGSGKSMLIKVLAQQQKPSSGNISFSGRDIETLLQRGFARKLACLSQFMPATDGRNVEKFVARGRSPWHGTFGRFTTQGRPRLTKRCDRPMWSRSGHDLSTGVLEANNRVSGRQCFWHRTPPVSYSMKRPRCSTSPIREAMLNLIKLSPVLYSRSAMIVLHDINMAARTCDRMVALGGDRMVADETPDAPLRPEILQRIWSRNEGHQGPDGDIPVPCVK